MIIVNVRLSKHQFSKIDKPLIQIRHRWKNISASLVQSKPNPLFLQPTHSPFSPSLRIFPQNSWNSVVTSQLLASHWSSDLTSDALIGQREITDQVYGTKPRLTLTLAFSLHTS